MRIKPFVLAAIACGCLVVGCKARETAAPAAVETPPPPASYEPTSLPAVEVVATPAEAMPTAGVTTPSTIPKAVPPAAAVQRPSATVPAKSAPKPSPSARPLATAAVSEPVREVPTLRPAPPTSAPAAPTQAAKASKVTDPGGPIAVAATKPGLTRIGAEKCKTCHKVQFASWAESAHAKRTPPLDCENCHGPGSEYKAMAIMKDPEKARAAGMVIPTATFCAKCHTSGWKDDMLRKAHAHKSGT